MNVHQKTSPKPHIIHLPKPGPNVSERKLPKLLHLEILWAPKKKSTIHFNRPLPLKRKTVVPYRSFGSSSDEVRVPSGHRTAFFQPWDEISMHFLPWEKRRGVFLDQPTLGDFGLRVWSCTVVESKNYRCPQQSDVCVYRRV